MEPKNILTGVVCDKCGKETVTEEIVMPYHQDPPKKMMSDYEGFGGSSAVSLVYLITDYKLTCLSCGNAREFSR